MFRNPKQCICLVLCLILMLGLSSVALAVSSCGGNGYHSPGFSYVEEITIAQDGSVFMVGRDSLTFVSVSIDNAPLTKGTDYEILPEGGEGKTVVSLSEAFVDTLDDGEHFIRVQYINGRADSFFVMPATVS